MTFSYLVTFAGNLGMLINKYGGFFSGVYIIRFIKYIFRKLKKILHWLVGIKPTTKETLDQAFHKAAKSTKNNNNNNNGNKYNILSIGFYTFGILWLLQWIYRSIKKEVTNKKKEVYKNNK